MKTIILDAMGTDARPNAEILGAYQALKSNPNIIVKMVGKRVVLEKKLKHFEYDPERLIIVDAPEEVEMSESPTKALKEKKNSSMAIGMRMLRNNEGDAFVSAGNTGAVMTYALVEIGRIQSIQRPAIATIIPTPYGHTILTDSGANADCKPVHLLHFAIMADVYARLVFNIERPRIGLLSNGEEKEKGNELTKEANKLISEAEFLNFVGNVEGRDILSGEVDVVVCDGFTGNIVLKAVESLFKFIFKLFKSEVSRSILAKIGVLFLMPAIKRILKKTDYAEFGGAPLLGVKKPVMICHGSSNEKAIKNAILYTYKYLCNDVNAELTKELKKMKGMHLDEKEAEEDN